MFAAADPAAEERARRLMLRVVLAMLAVLAITGAIAVLTHGATTGVLALVHAAATGLLAAVGAGVGIVVVWFSVFGLWRP